MLIFLTKFLTNRNFPGVKDHQTNVQPYKALQIGPIDFYLCPKCATNTLRYASYKYNHLDSSLVLPEYRKGSNDYDMLKLTNSEITYQKERSNSIKVAVCRDPVERFESAVAWYNFRNKSMPNVNVYHRDDKHRDINMVLQKIPFDIHFYPQTEFYGDPTKYDLIIRPDKIRSTIRENAGVDFGNLHVGKNPNDYEKANDEQVKIIKEIYKEDYMNGYV